MKHTRRTLLAFALASATGEVRAASALSLVMVERHGCPWCDRWNREVAPAYERSDEGRIAPLRRMTLDNGQPKLKLKEPVRYTPTFLLVENDKEIGRITGYLDNAMFWGLLGVLIKRAGETAERTNP